MLSSVAKEKALKSSNKQGSNALSARYDRLCPFHKRGGRCQQHDDFLRWCSDKERNEAQTQLLASSAAMVMLTFREDTIQKIDCPYLHIESKRKGVGLGGKDYAFKKQAAKQAVQNAANRNAMMIEALVDYFVVAAASTGGEERRKQQQQQHVVAPNNKKKNDDDDDGDDDDATILRSRERTTSVTSNMLYIPEQLLAGNNSAPLVERDESSAIFADGIISSTQPVDEDEEDDALGSSSGEKKNNNNNDDDDDDMQQPQPPKQVFVASPFFNSLSDECRRRWRSYDITFNNVDFCTCFSSAVAVLVKTPELFGKKKVHSIYLGDNHISSDGLSNIIKAMKTTMIPQEIDPQEQEQQQQKSRKKNKDSLGDGNTIAATNGVLIYGGHTSAASINALTKNATAAATGQAVAEQQCTLASQILLLDLSANKLDTMHFLFELKVHFPRLLSLFIGNNPITRRPDYRDFIRRTVPQIVMLDGESVRKPPLSMAFPTFEHPLPPLAGGQQQQQQQQQQKLTRLDIFQRAARLFVAAYLCSWEGDFSTEMYRDDDATELRDAILHPSVLFSLTVQGGANLQLDLPADVMTDEMIAAATEAPGMRGGQVGTRSRAAAQQIAEQRLLSKHNVVAAAAAAATSSSVSDVDSKTKRRQRDDDDDGNSKDEEKKKDPSTLTLEERKAQQLRIITKLDAKLLRSLPVSLLRNSRNITEGVTSLDRIAKGRLEVVELLAATIYPEGLLVAHHTEHSFCDVIPINPPSLFLEQQEAAETAERQKTHAGVIAAAKAAAAKAKKKSAADAAAASSLFGQNKLKQPDLFLVTVHGLISWRVPSLTGQQTVTVAADHTFSIVATEEPDFFQQREQQLHDKEQRYWRRMMKNSQQKGVDGDGEMSSDEDQDDEEFKTLQELQRDELIRSMQGFRLCNHAVTLRSPNTIVESTIEQGSSKKSNKGDGDGALSTMFPFARFLFDPIRPSRVMRLAHMYGCKPESVLRVMERTNSDAAAEAVLAKSLQSNNVE